MRAILLTFFAALMLSALPSATPAQAQEKPWCLEYNGGKGSGYTRCNFISLEQCLESRLGEGGNCRRNPAYVYRDPEPRTSRRR